MSAFFTLHRDLPREGGGCALGDRGTPGCDDLRCGLRVASPLTSLCNRVPEERQSSAGTSVPSTLIRQTRVPEERQSLARYFSAGKDIYKFISPSGTALIQTTAHFLPSLKPRDLTYLWQPGFPTNTDLRTRDNFTTSTVEISTNQSQRINLNESISTNQSQQINLNG